MSYVIAATNTGVHVGVCHVVVCWSGQFLNDVGRHADGAVSYVTASQLSADDFELIFNTASALRSHLISLLCTVCQRALFVRYLTCLLQCEIIAANQFLLIVCACEKPPPVVLKRWDRTQPGLTVNKKVSYAKLCPCTLSCWFSEMFA